MKNDNAIPVTILYGSLLQNIDLLTEVLSDKQQVKFLRRRKQSLTLLSQDPQTDLQLLVFLINGLADFKLTNSATRAIKTICLQLIQRNQITKS